MHIDKQAVSAVLLSVLVCTAHANPGGATVVNGSVSFARPDASTLNITNTPGAIINWQQFSIAQGELTRFLQQSSSSSILNRVTGQDPSQILGQLQSNGQVYLINPNGVIFGRNAVIDTAGLIASTLNISDENFLNGHLHFEDLANNASILNQGFIHTSNAGEVVLVAPTIENEGVIDVEDGHLVLAAGKSVTLSSLNYDNIEFEVQAPDNKVINLGELLSDGGAIGVFAGSIENSGTVSANAITVNDAGEIELVAQGDNVQQDGSVTATSVTGLGGHIEILGERVGLFGETTVDASGATGGGEVLVGGDYQGGNPDVRNATQTAVSDDTQIRADADHAGDGGKVIVWSDVFTLFHGLASARGGLQQGDGGFVEISGKQNLGYNGFVDASASNGHSGMVLFDPLNIIVENGGPGAVPLFGMIKFADSPSATLSIDADSITAITNNSTNVLLEATNDITVNEDIISFTGDGSGNLALRAGRSVFINANIQMEFNSVLIDANYANGFTATQREAGTAVITMKDGVSIDTGSFGQIEIELHDGKGLSTGTSPNVNTSAGNITLATLTTGDIRITQNALDDGASVLTTANGLITADSVLIDHFGWDVSIGGGSIGAIGAPLEIQTDFLGAHIHAPTDRGIYIYVAPRNNFAVTIGNTCFGNGTCGNHTIKGVETLQGGDIELTVTSGDLFVFNTALDNEIFGSGNKVNINVQAGSFTTYENVTASLGNIEIIASGDILISGNGNAPNPVTVSGNSVKLQAGNNLTLQTSANFGESTIVKSTSGNITARAGGMLTFSSLASPSSNTDALMIANSGNGNVYLKYSTCVSCTFFVAPDPIANDTGISAFDIVLAPVFWDNTTGDGLWETAANWSTGALPGQFDNVVADVFSDPLLLSSFQQAGSVYIDNTFNMIAGSELEIDLGAMLQVNGAYNLDGGVMNLTNAGDGYATAEINGVMNWTGGATVVGDLVNTSGSPQFFVNPGGTLNLSGSGQSFVFGSIGIANSGSVVIDNSVDTQVQLNQASYYDNDGTTEIKGSSGFSTLDTGSLNILAGIFTAQTGSTYNTDITISGGTLTANGTFILSGAYAQTGGNATFNDTATFGNVCLTGLSPVTVVLNGVNNTVGSLAMTSGNAVPSFLGTGNTTVGNLFTWSGGTVSHNLLLNGGVDIVDVSTQSGGVITLPAGKTATLGSTLNIANGGIFNNQGTFDILGNFNIQGNLNIQSTTSDGSFNNQGLLKNTVGSFSGIDALLINTGDIDIGSATLSLNNISQWNGGTFTGTTGSIFINASMTLNSTAGKTLNSITLVIPDGVDLTILGEGDLMLTNSATIDNGAQFSFIHASNGDILSDGSNTRFLNGASGSGHFINTAGDTVIDVAFDNTSGIIDVDGGTLTFSKGLFNDVSSQVNIKGGTLVLSEAGVPTDSGNYTLTSGALQVNSSRNFANSGYDFTGGVFRVDNGAVISINQGTGGVSNFGDLVLDGASSIGGNDVLAVGGVFNWLNGSSTASGLTINPGATMNVQNALSSLTTAFVNDGLVEIFSGATLELQQGNVYAGNFTVDAGGALDLSNGVHTINGALSGGGAVKVSSPTATLDLTSNGTIGSLQMLDGLVTGNGNLTTTELSTLAGGTFGPGGNTNFNAGVDITGPVTINRVMNVSGGSISGAGAVAQGTGAPAAFNLAGGVFTVAGSNSIDTGVTINAGTLAVAGTLDVSQASVGVDNVGGVIQGSGIIIGNVTNDSAINPGTSPGTLTIDGNLTLLSNSNLNMEIAGLQTGQYDVLDVIGNIVLGGKMNIFVDTSTGYHGQLNDTFTPIRWLSSSGGSLAVVSATPGYSFDFTIDTHGLTVVTVSIPGLTINDLPITETLVFTDTVKTFLTPFVRSVFEDDEEDEDKGRTLVCS